MQKNSELYRAARKFREHAKRHVVGSSGADDVSYMENFNAIINRMAFPKQDNLLLPSPSRLLHETSFTLAANPVKDIYTSPADEHMKIESEVQVSAKQLGVSEHTFERNLPVPSRSLFRFNPKVFNQTQQQGVEKKSKGALLEPDVVGLLLRSYLLLRLEEEDVSLLKNSFMFIGKDIGKKVVLSRLYQEKARTIFFNFLDCKHAKTQRELVEQDQKLKKLAGPGRFKLRHTPYVDVKIKGEPGLIFRFNSKKQFPCKLNQTYQQEMTLRNKRKYPVFFRLTFKSTRSKDYDLLVHPNCFKNYVELKKGQNLILKFSFNAHRPLRMLQKLLVMEIRGGPRVYLGINAFVETKAFGIDPELLECVHVEGLGRVPRVLEHIKKEMFKNMALESIGIFRKAGHEAQMRKIIKEFDSDIFPTCKNVNNFATLIKVWFRSLPVKIFDHYPTSYFQQVDAKSTAACLDTLNGLPEMSIKLINWLLDFMMMVEENSAINKMNTSNLAIVFSPNLYCAKSKNPATLMMMTSKMSQFFQTLLELRISQTQKLGFEEEYFEEGEGEVYYEEYYEEEGNENGEYYYDDSPKSGEFYKPK